MAEKYLHKGDQVYIEGKLRTRQWEKDGVTRYSTEVVGENMTMLGGRPRTEGATASPQAAVTPSQSAASEPAGSTPPAAASPAPTPTTESSQDEVDDLPF